MENAAQNTDKEIYREDVGNYYSDSIHVTEHGGIGINCGGTVIVKTIREWHKLAMGTEPATSNGKPQEDALGSSVPTNESLIEKTDLRDAESLVKQLLLCEEKDCPSCKRDTAALRDIFSLEYEEESNEPWPACGKCNERLWKISNPDDSFHYKACSKCEPQAASSEITDYIQIIEHLQSELKKCNAQKREYITHEDVDRFQMKERLVIMGYVDSLMMHYSGQPRYGAGDDNVEFTMRRGEMRILKQVLDYLHERGKTDIEGQ